MKKSKLWSLLVMLSLILAACAPKASPTVQVSTASTASPTAPVHYTFIPPGAESLCESSFSAPVTTGSASVPVRTLVNKVYEDQQWIFDPNLMQVPHDEPMEASTPVNTLLCVREDRTQEITYPDGQVGYKVSWDVRLVLYPTGEVAGAQEFAGDEPPVVEEYNNMKDYSPGPAYGDRPAGTLLEWLFPALGDRTVFTYGSPIFNIVLSPDGKTLAAGGSSTLVKLWNVTTGELMRSIDIGSDEVAVFSLAIAPDGKTLATQGSYPIILQLWDFTNGEQLTNFSSEEYLGIGIQSLVFSPDGSMLASGNWDGTVRLWDMATGTMQRALSGQTDMIMSLVFSPDGKTLASGSLDHSVKLWNATTWQEIRTLSGHTDGVESVAFSPDGKLLASGSDDLTVIIWDAATGQALHTFTGEESMTSVAFSPDGRILAAAEVTEVRLWDVATWELLRVLDGHNQSVRGLVFTPDGNTLISGSIDTTIKLWDLTK